MKRRVNTGAVDDQTVLGLERGRPVDGLDTVSRRARLHPLRHRIGDTMLVARQVGPVDRRRQAGHASADDDQVIGVGNR